MMDCTALKDEAPVSAAVNAVLADFTLAYLRLELALSRHGIDQDALHSLIALNAGLDRLCQREVLTVKRGALPAINSLCEYGRDLPGVDTYDGHLQL